MLPGASFATGLAAVRASVALPHGGCDVVELPRTPSTPETGWLQVTASGICGTDVALHARGVAKPTVLGHHVVGRIADIGERAARRWEVEVGDRVVLEEYLPCETCGNCRSGVYRLCPQTDIWDGGRRIGTIPVDEAPGLFGGNAEYTFLPANAVLHQLPDTLDDELAAWVLPYANALDWTSGAGRMQRGETVVVLGPGYHGLAVIAAAIANGTADVVVTGLPHDRERLDLAQRMGARPALAGTADQLLPDGADLVIDTTGNDPSTLAPALELLRHGGRLVLTTPKSAAVDINTTRMIRRGLSVHAVRGRAPAAIAKAMTSLAAGDSRLDLVPSIGVSLDGVGDMLTRLATGDGPQSPHVIVRPSR